MELKLALFAVALWSVDLLFCLCNLALTSAQTSNVLMIVSAGMAAIIGLRFLIKKVKITTPELCVLSFPMLLLFGLFLTIMFRGENALASSVLKCFICYAIPMTLLAIITYEDDEMLLVGRYVDIILLLFTIYLLYILRNGVTIRIAVRNLQSDTNIGYQSTSYYGAYAYVLSLYALLFRKINGNGAKRTLMYVYRLGIIILSLVVAVYGSGKGAMVVIVLSTILLVFLYLNNSKSFLKFLCICGGMIILISLLMKIVAQNETLSQAFDRIYALFGTGTVDYYTTSGRTDIYQRCLNAFLESPIIGHGIAGAYYIGIGQPHQMFLEILVEGGLVYLGVWLFIIFRTCRRVAWLLKHDQQNSEGYIFLISTCFAQVIGLQFSGFYMQSYSIWFFIAYVNLRELYVRRNDKCNRS